MKFAQPVIGGISFSPKIGKIAADLFNLGIPDIREVTPDVGVRILPLKDNNACAFNELLDEMMGGVIGSTNGCPKASWVRLAFQQSVR